MDPAVFEAGQINTSLCDWLHGFNGRDFARGDGLKGPSFCAPFNSPVK
jgi:hypothetical protein